MGIDVGVIVLYLVIINVIGIRYSASATMKDYFLGSRSIPWVVACFSIVATETSTLTFISIPGLAYIQGMGFLQVAFGYLVGRILVAVLLLPKYFQGQFETVYGYLQSRFSVASRKVVSVIFHITRVLADSVRLFATAIPLSVITGWDYRLSILVIGLATFAYTYYGGLRSVVTVDSIQLVLYLVCAFLGMGLIADRLSLSIPAVFREIPASSLKVFFSGLGSGLSGLFGSYNIVSGLIGGAFLSFASHGTDHLLVQRVLSCKTRLDAQKAMIFSGVMIIFQFLLFLLLGLFIKVLLNGAHFARSDEILPHFVVHYLPPGMRGVMLAGIFAAAMSTLSSSINSLSSSTAVDLLGIDRWVVSEKRKVGISRMISLFWALAIVGMAILMRNTTNPLVEVGLSIASVAYDPLDSGLNRSSCSCSVGVRGVSADLDKRSPPSSSVAATWRPCGLIIRWTSASASASAPRSRRA